MAIRRYSSEAIVLKRKNFGEADRIITLLSKDYGKIVLIANGVRKPKSKKRGGLEVFSKIKFAASGTRGFDILTEVLLIDSYQEVRLDLKRASVAYFIVEAVDKLTREGEKNIHLYISLVNCLEEIGELNSLRKLREDFITDSLVLLGFWPKGKLMPYPDRALENVVEREMVSKRVGKRVLD